MVERNPCLRTDGRGSHLTFQKTQTCILSRWPLKEVTWTTDTTTLQVPSTLPADVNPSCRPITFSNSSKRFR